MLLLLTGLVVVVVVGLGFRLKRIRSRIERKPRPVVELAAAAALSPSSSPEERRSGLAELRPIFCWLSEWKRKRKWRLEDE